MNVEELGLRLPTAQCPVPFLGIYVSNFRYTSNFAVYALKHGSEEGQP
jgi:hypothetical protein